MEEPLVRFACIGDWGSRTPRLLEVAKHMTLNLHDFEFVIALGDNFYFAGVTSISDGKWAKVFEEPFGSVKCPWFPILGNHDWEGDPFAQISYSTINERWKMNSLYYSHKFANGQVEIFFIDTTSLCPQESEALTGKKFSLDDSNAQYQWLDEQLARSRAKWKVVCGHYPVYSNGENGGALELQRLERMMFRHKVDAYLCGHDHSMQHLFNAKSNIHFFVNGSGSSTRFFKHPNLPAQTLWKALSCGYLQVEIYCSSMRMIFINNKGLEEYSFDIPKVSQEVPAPACFVSSACAAAVSLDAMVVDSSDCELNGSGFSDAYTSDETSPVTVNETVFSFPSPASVNSSREHSDSDMDSLSSK